MRLSRENTRMSDNIAVKSGYLMKKGERRKAWKKRWFVLRGGQVAMYKNDKVRSLSALVGAIATDLASDAGIPTPPTYPSH